MRRHSRHWKRCWTLSWTAQSENSEQQTDRPGQYERRVLESVTDADPDLILLAGDYLHISNNAKYLIAKAALNALLWRTQLEAPLGMYSIRGNVDWGDWNELFTGLPVVDIHTTSSYDLGPLVLTGLSLEDSGNIQPDLPAQDKFHIVLGHRPDFSLGQVDADLLIAGHTHGGQVRIPFIGPLFAVSMVPRSWAFGITEIAPGKYLIVSRGIGMERANASRMRFLCRPELLIIDLVPVG